MGQYTLLIVILLTSSICVSSQEPNEGDIQVWNETKIYFKSITKKDNSGKKTVHLSLHHGYNSYRTRCEAFCR